MKDENDQKWNNVYFKMHFWLILKDNSERFMTTQQCKYKSWKCTTAVQFINDTTDIVSFSET